MQVIFVPETDQTGKIAVTYLTKEGFAYLFKNQWLPTKWRSRKVNIVEKLEAQSLPEMREGDEQAEPQKF